MFLSAVLVFRKSSNEDVRCSSVEVARSDFAKA